VAAACNDASHRVEQMTQERMSGLTAGMALPPGLKLRSDVSSDPPLLQRLVEACAAAGVGPKSRSAWLFTCSSATARVAGAAALLAEAMERVGHCRRCRTLSDREVCPLCANPNRDDACCAWWRRRPRSSRSSSRPGSRGATSSSGRLSPLDGIGPRELSLDSLRARLAEVRCAS